MHCCDWAGFDAARERILAGVRSGARTSDPLSGCYLFRRDAVAGVEFRPLGYKTLMEIMALGRVETIRECSYHMSERRLGRSKVTARHWFEYVHHLLRLHGMTRTRELRMR